MSTIDAPGPSHVAVIYGGESAERKVSLATGEAVAKALESRGYKVTRFDWAASRLPELAQAGFDAAFIALHGGAGENGELQGALELLGLPYTGSGVLASALAMDKARTKALVAGAGMPTAAWHIWTRAEAARAREERLPAPMSVPFVVKPTADGSSVGVSIVARDDQFEEALGAVFQGRGDVLFEAYVAGRELTVAVLDGEALGVCEVQPGDTFYDFAAKYERQDTKYLIPSTFGEPVESELMSLASKLYALLGCRGVARVDFIVTEAGEPYLLEINTVPGMTEKSLVPKIAASRGMSFAELAEAILRSSDTDTRGETQR